jgi:hypothetical protein
MNGSCIGPTGSVDLPIPTPPLNGQQSSIITPPLFNK